MELRTRKIAILIYGLLATITIGCGPSGPEIATVEGTVTLDGKPLSEASVLFVNQSGRPAAAWTDENGKYKLMFDENRSGAIPGENQIRITTARDGTEGKPGRKESLAAEYNVRSNLTFNVEANKKNIANFDLKSGGKVDRGAGSD